MELARSAGLLLDDWQQWVLEESLSEQRDNRWSAFRVGLIVGRQNGKGSILEARQLAGLFLLGESLQVHTAHEFKTAFEHFLRVVNLVEANPELDRQVMRIRRGAGEQAVELKSGERLRFIARSSGSGRGMSGEAVYLDEGFALTQPMMGALLPTMSAQANPQVWITSSAPLSTSAVLHDLRRHAIDGKDERLFFAEWGNEPTVDPDDTDAWARANPALGIRISHDFIKAERAAMPLEEFLRERLGVPTPEPVDTELRDPAIPADAWDFTSTTEHVDIEPGELVIGFDISPGGHWGSIAIAAGTVQSPYIELIEHREGTGWMPDRLVELVQRWQPRAVVSDGVGPVTAVIGSVLHSFRQAGISPDLIHQLSTRDYKAACAGFLNDVVEGRLRHPRNQGALDLAAADATERTLGDSWAWDRRRATVPISPLVAATVARSLLTADAAPRPVFAF